MDTETKNIFQGQVEVWKNIYGYVDYMALKCAVELGIPDILQSQNRPLSLSEIVSKISNAPSPNIQYLYRIMRMLVYKKIFTSSTLPNSGMNALPTVTVYGPTATSHWLVRHKNELSLAPLLLLQNHPYVRDALDQLSACVREGGDAFHKAHGFGIFDFPAQNPEFHEMFKESKKFTWKMTMDAIISWFGKDAWNGLESLVVLEGGNGQTISDIVMAYPHIKGINFDLPDVIAAAPKPIGVSHVGGDMFDAIPSAQAVFIMWILHIWDDESCVKILQNCKKAIPELRGKIFIVDLVLKNPDTDEAFRTALEMDLVAVALTRGKLRTEVQWISVLEKGGFHRYKFTQILNFYTIIEAYPK